MTNPLEAQPPYVSLAEFNQAVTAGNEQLVHEIGIQMLDTYFDQSLTDNPELWTPQGRRGYLLRQTCVREDGTPIDAGSTVVVSRNTYKRRYQVSSYSTDGPSSIVSAEWRKDDTQMIHVWRADGAGRRPGASIMSPELVELTVSRAHPDLTEIVAPKGFRAFCRYLRYRGLDWSYLTQSTRFPGATRGYSED